MYRLRLTLCTLAACAAVMAPAASRAAEGDLSQGGLNWRAQLRLGAPAASLGQAGLSGAAGRYALPTGMLLGDYYFARTRWTWSQGLRASGGLYLAGNVTLAELSLPTQVQPFSLRPWAPESAAPDTRPYLGLGYSRQGSASSAWARWGISADLGWVASRGSTGLGARRTLDDAVREIRFSPVLQLGVRYGF